jgi:hypothetical protein
VQPNQHQLPPLPFAEQSSSGEEAHRLPSQALELHCYYPENIYVSSVLPTRTPRELQNFHEHCRQQYTSYSGLEVVFNHKLDQALGITTSPLNFQNLLWRTRIVLTPSGILEEYYWIRRRIRANSTDRATLEPAYNVAYPWNSDGWIVSRHHSGARFA